MSTTTTPVPPIRRVITGHNPTTGKAIILSDTTLPATSFADPSRPLDPSAHEPGITVLFRTNPVSATDSTATNNEIDPFKKATPPGGDSGDGDPYGKPALISEPGHTNWRIVDFPPRFTAPMHRTLSVDVAVVLTGQIVLELDDGVEAVLEEQSGLVQRGTVHAWHNRTDRYARVMFVVMPSDPVKVEGSGEVLPERQMGE